MGMLLSLPMAFLGAVLIWAAARGYTRPSTGPEPA
jgi:hypothetical protein